MSKVMLHHHFKTILMSSIQSLLLNVNEVQTFGSFGRTYEENKFEKSEIFVIVEKTLIFKKSYGGIFLPLVCKLFFYQLSRHTR